MLGPITGTQRSGSIAGGPEQNQPVTPKDSWISTEYKRAPWIRPGLQLGEHIAAPNEQASNNDLQDDEVLQRRDEPIGASLAHPLSTGQDRPTGGIAPDIVGSGRGIAS